MRLPLKRLRASYWGEYMSGKKSKMLRKQVLAKLENNGRTYEVEIPHEIDLVQRNPDGTETVVKGHRFTVKNVGFKPALKEAKRKGLDVGSDD